MTRVVRFALGALALLVVVAVASTTDQFERGEPPEPVPRAVLDIESGLTNTNPDAEEQDNPIEVPQPIVVAISIGFGIGLLYLLSRQRISSWRVRKPSIEITRNSSVEVTEEVHAEAAAEFARDLIDELNEGDSPRYAIQRAYAAVETGFGAPDLARKPAETPLRYLDRIFGRHQSIQPPLERLTDLFQQARFSNEPVDEAMRAEAIHALVEIREYYVSIAWRKIRRSRATSRS